MKKGDYIWISFLSLIVFLLLFPTTHKEFIRLTSIHPYLMGFVKVSILATMGEILALRIVSGDYTFSKGIIYRFIIWGFIGITFSLIFELFALGVLGVMNKGLLPSLKGNTFSSKLLTAFFTSSLMNIIFAPTFMTFHRITDTYIDLGQGNLKKILSIRLSDVIEKIDWNGFISFVVLKTIPFFWIPAHTITFMLPKEYRVLVAAFLSIALGGILAFSKRRNLKASL